MNEHLVDVVDQTLSLGRPVAWPGMAILIWNIIVAKVKFFYFLFIYFLMYHFPILSGQIKVPNPES